MMMKTTKIVLTNAVLLLLVNSVAGSASRQRPQSVGNGHTPSRIRSAGPPPPPPFIGTKSKCSPVPPPVPTASQSRKKRLPLPGHKHLKPCKQEGCENLSKPTTNGGQTNCLKCDKKRKMEEIQKLAQQGSRKAFGRWAGQTRTPHKYYLNGKSTTLDVPELLKTDTCTKRYYCLTCRERTVGERNVPCTPCKAELLKRHNEKVLKLDANRLEGNSQRDIVAAEHVPSEGRVQSKTTAHMRRILDEIMKIGSRYKKCNDYMRLPILKKYYESGSYDRFMKLLRIRVKMTIDDETTPIRQLDSYIKLKRDLFPADPKHPRHYEGRLTYKNFLLNPKLVD